MPKSKKLGKHDKKTKVVLVLVILSLAAILVAFVARLVGDVQFIAGRVSRETMEMIATVQGEVFLWGGIVFSLSVFAIAVMTAMDRRLRRSSTQ